MRCWLDLEHTNNQYIQTFTAVYGFARSFVREMDFARTNTCIYIIMALCVEFDINIKCIYYRVALFVHLNQTLYA